MFKEFRAFIARGNVLELAVAVVIGVAFGKIVTSLVEGLVMPPIGMLTGGIDFTSLFVVLDSSKGVPASLAEAKTKGIPVIAYGQFINDVINFLVIAAVIFLIVRQYNKLTAKPDAAAAPATKECPYCLSKIPPKATRCPHCIAELKPS